MEPLSSVTTPQASLKSNLPDQDRALWNAAKELEASFLSEMLKSAGIGKTPDSFGGGVGEDQFASFLRQEQARSMVDSGGIGLAQSLFDALKEQTDAAS